MWKKLLGLDRNRERSSNNKLPLQPPYTTLGAPHSYDWIFRGSTSSEDMPPLIRCQDIPSSPPQLMNNKTYQEEIHTKLKCVLVGDGAVGKTSLVVSYTTNGYPTEYVPTAFDNYNVVVTVDNQPVRLQLCDTAGQDDFDNLRPLCYPGCDVFLVCFSVVSPTSFYNVRDKWLAELRRHISSVPIILVGTQSDLRTDVKVLIDLAQFREHPVSEAAATKMAQQIGAVAYIECSALTQKNLKEVFDQAITVGIKDPSQYSRKDSRRVSKRKNLLTTEHTLDYADEGGRKRGWRKMCCFS